MPPGPQSRHHADPGVGQLRTGVPTRQGGSGVLRSLYEDEGYRTLSSEAQAGVEASCSALLRRRAQRPARLARDAHQRWAGGGLCVLPQGVSGLDASRTWLFYWSTHACDLLGAREQTCSPGCPLVDSADAVDFFVRCFTVTEPAGGEAYGGFAGGPGQIAHLAPTYSAAMGLCIIGTDAALTVLKERRQLLANWFLRLRQPDGSTIMHIGGETDVRAAYCMAVLSTLLGIATPELLAGMADHIGRCQTHEGGIGCQPYEEAHGGYTFCGTAALALLRRTDVLNLPRLKSWLARRQAAVEGGFNGRTNKLTDACYSFWVGATATIIRAVEASQRAERNAGVPLDLHDLAAIDSIAYDDADEMLARMAAAAPAAPPPTPAPPAASLDAAAVEALEPLEVDRDDWEDVLSDDGERGGLLNFDQVALQSYLLYCCQSPTGGLRDKPEVPPDYYHTCYSLSGMAVAQDLGTEHLRHRYGLPSVFSECRDVECDAAGAPEELRRVLRSASAGGAPVFAEEPRNTLLRHVNPLFNIRRERAARALRFFHCGRHALPGRV
eukprot:TRINITY_DN12677_c0_g1_i1.p1 TRINITY_DN12677_c0_g1~~TRINITY_DN12677_c0_g1_i1.p1  ORF type:complete len:580 (+),score=142.40 TRINITY_DN12677_c0_g1_i1:83-1741(+)